MTEQEREWFEKLRDKKRRDKEVLVDDEEYSGYWNDIVTEKYSDTAHFIYELLQNADDADAEFVKFDLKKDGLWITHNGKEAFSVTDPKSKIKGHINSITSIGNSGKNKNEQEIGKFGIGFKAVFVYTATPKIYDDKFNFIIENYIVPDFIEPTDYPRKPGETLFYLPFNNPNKTKEKAYDEILEKLKKLVYPILFLNNLKRILWETENERGEYLQEKGNKQNFNNIDYRNIKLIQDIDNKMTSETILLFTSKAEIKEQNHSYSVGFFLENNRLRPKQLPAFCFLPTKEITGLNFIIHAPFLLESSRAGIKENESDNIKLINLLAKLSADSLLILKEMKLIEDNIINIIPYKQSIELFLPFYEKIKQKFQTEELLPAKDGTFARKENAYWAFAPNMTKLFDNKQLAELTKEGSKWVFSKFGYQQTIGIDKEMAKYIEDLIDNPPLSPIKILSYINQNFIQNQTFEWLHKLYGYLAENKSYQDGIKTKPIFKDENGNAVSAFENEKLNLYFQAKSGYKTIHPTLLANDNSKDFFIKFGIKKEPDLEGVVNKLLNDNDDINEHFSTILEYYKKCKECLQVDKINMLVKDLENKKLFVENGMAKAGEIYYPTPDLRRYFETKPDTKFLDLERYYNFIEEKDRNILEEFLLKIGIVKYPRIISIDRKYSDLDEQQQKQVRPRYTQKWRLPKFSDKIIDGCREIMDKIKTEKDKSILLWKQLLDMIRYNDNFNLRGKHEYRYRSYRSNRKDTCTIFDSSALFDSSAFILLTQSEWLITKKEEFASANEIDIDDLSKDYDTESEYAKKLIDFLEIKKRHPSENDDAAKSLGFENAEEAEKAKKALNKLNKYSPEDLAKLDEIKAKGVLPPGSNSGDIERRRKKIVDEYLGARPKTFEPRVINVRTSGSKDSKSYLQEKNTNYDNQLICQICKKEMPFRKKDGEYYFEITEIFSKTDILYREMEQSYLALCPVCAAKYRSGGFVDDDQKNKIKEKIFNENIEANKDNYEIPISLDYETTICFVAKHFIDLKAILKLSSSPQITHNVEDSKDKFANLNSTEEEQQIEKVKRRIGKWFAKKEQKNSRILYAFIKLFKENNEIVTFKELKQETEMEDFETNFNQMKNFDPHNHGKIFEQEGERIRFWEKVENIIWDYYKKT